MCVVHVPGICLLRYQSGAILAAIIANSFILVVEYFLLLRAKEVSRYRGTKSHER